MTPLLPVKLKEVGDGSDKTCLANAWRPGKKVAALSSLADTGIVVATGGEAEEVILKGGIDHEGVEG